MRIVELEADLLVSVEGRDPVQIATVRFPVSVGTDGVMRGHLAEFVAAMRGVVEAAEGVVSAGERR